MPKRQCAARSIDHGAFRRIFERKGLRGRHENPASKPNAWFAALRDSVWDDLEKRGSLPDLDLNEVLEWADAHRARTGEWPGQDSAPIPESPGETWLAVEAGTDVWMCAICPAVGRSSGCWQSTEGSTTVEILTSRSSRS